MQIAESLPAHREASARPTEAAVEPRHAARIARMARRLAYAMADAADADQVAVAIDGIEGMDDRLPEDSISRDFLTLLNGGKPAVHHLAIVLRSGGRTLGTVRLATLRPTGFQPDEIARAQMDAYHASELLAAALDGAVWPHTSVALDGVVDIIDARAAREVLAPLAG